MPKTPRRIKLRFSLKSLILIPTVAVCCFGFFVNRAMNELKAIRYFQDEKANVSFVSRSYYAWLPKSIRSRCDDLLFVHLDGWILTRQSDVFGHDDPRRLSQIEKRHLENLPYIKHLRLANRRGICDEDLSCLQFSSRLERIELHGTGVSGKGLRYILKHSNLQHLSVGPNVTREMFSNIAKMTELRSLTIVGDDTTDQDLDCLKALSKLELLHVHSNKITDAGLVKIPRDAPLKNVRLSCRAGTLDGLRKLESELKSLELLLPPVGRLEPKTNKDFQQERQINGDELTAALQNLAGFHFEPDVRGGIEGLWLWGSPLSEESIISLVSQVPEITTLGLNGVNAGDRLMQHLGELDSLTSLELELTQISDEGVSWLSSIPNLQHLLIGESRLTGRGLSQLSGCKTLRRLELRGPSTNFSATDLRRLTRSIPQCEILVDTQLNRRE